MNHDFYGAPMVPVPDGPAEVPGTVSTTAGSTALCPPCGVRRPVDGKGRFRDHQPAREPDIEPEDGLCWASGRTLATVELVEAMNAGTSTESLGMP